MMSLEVIDKKEFSNIFMEDNQHKDKLEFIRTNDDVAKDKLIETINEYKKYFNDGVDIKDIKNRAKLDFGEDLYLLLELDSFFKTLKLKQKLNPSDAILYFDEYKSEIPNLFLKIKNDYSKYNIDDKFLALNKLKEEKEKERKISKDIFKKERNALFIELLKMIEWLKETDNKILITIDGRDSSGKGSFIRFFESNTPEKIVSHSWFDVPSKYQQKNWFFRYIKELPSQGHLKIFDRSWYNRAVNDPVNGYCTEKEYKKFMKDVVPFEKDLIDGGIIYIKLWFSIDKETQEFRFNLRKANPLKYWKFSDNDATAVEKYDIFTFYKEQMFIKTSTKKSPWVIIDMNDKKLGQLNALKYILNKIPYSNKNNDIIKPSKIKVLEL